MTWTWRPTDDPTPPQHRWSAVDVAAVGALARARAVEPAQQGRSSRVALGSRPLRSGSGSEWDPGSCLPCSTTPYWRRPLSPITTVVNVRSHLAAGSTRISSNASYLMEPATCCCDQLISYPSPRLPQNQPLLPLVPLAITDEASPLALRSPQTIFRGEQCTTGALLAPAKAGEGRGGVVADIAKLSVGREAYYTRELATDHEQYLSGHGESPGRWYGAGLLG